jgi:hypothetical protein
LRYTLPPFVPKYNKVQIIFTLHSRNTITYTIDIVRALDSTYFYYNEKYPNRIEVVNNAKAEGHIGKCVEDMCLYSYQWYRDGHKIAPRDGLVDTTCVNDKGEKSCGIYYYDGNDNDSTSSRSIVGHTFMVQAIYVKGNRTWICGSKVPQPLQAAQPQGLHLYPNPVTGILKLRHHSLDGLKQKGIVLVYNAGNGALVLTVPISSADVQGGEVEVDVSSLQEGAYIVRFNGESALVVKKK